MKKLEILTLDQKGADAGMCSLHGQALVICQRLG